MSAYTFVEMEKEEPDEKTNYIAEARAAYSPSKVTAYTDRYWNSHNSAYPNFENMGGDCANFVFASITCRRKINERNRRFEFLVIGSAEQILLINYRKFHPHGEGQTLLGIIGWLMLRNIRSSVHHTFSSADKF